AMARKVSAAFGGSLRGKTIAILGLTFKPNTDDMREAPSIPLITALQDMGAKVRVHDPEGMEQARKVLPDVTYCDGPYACAENADALVIVTEWEQFRALDLERLREARARPVVADFAKSYRRKAWASGGSIYRAVGPPGPVSCSGESDPSELNRSGISKFRRVLIQDALLRREPNLPGF